MSSEDYTKSLVLDCGSGFTKAGTADVDISNRLIPSVWSVDKDGCYLFGDEAINKRKENPIKRLFDREYITNWDRTRDYWDYLLRKEFKVDLLHQNVLVGAHFTEKKGYKEKIIEIFLEDLKVQGFYLSGDSLLSLYGSGKIQGIVVDSGSGTTSVVASQDGLTNDYQELVSKVAGQDLDEYVKKSLGDEVQDSEFLRNIKHNKCRLESEGLLKKKETMNEEGSLGDKQHNYTLPDGSTVNITNELVQAPNILFNPKLIGSRSPGIHELVYECVHMSDYDSRRDLFGNIIVSGGNFNIPGVQQK